MDEGHLSSLKKRRPLKAISTARLVETNAAVAPLPVTSLHCLPRVRLLQLGDIHLPSGPKLKPYFDDKDQKFSPALKNIISRSPLKTVFRRVYEHIASGEYDAVLFMGDFTDVGNLEGYKACCRYIAGALQLGEKGEHSSVKVGVVPGNHDIDRVLARRPGMVAKFTPLANALREVGLPAPPIDRAISISIDKVPISVHIQLLNSCWGCGEDEYIPDLFRKPISDAISSVLTGQDAEKAAKLYYDQQLDTPAIHSDAIGGVCASIKTTSPSCVPVVVAHHNLLPQRLPRLAPYTELVNSGALRSSLMELDKAVIYLHGHIGKYVLDKADVTA